MMKKRIATWGLWMSIGWIYAQEQQDQPTKEQKWDQKFEQLGTILPTPNTYRTASGAPGAQYWQQRADYDIEVTLNDEQQSITGKETITYYNQSPLSLSYLWLQLDQNVRAPDSNTPLTQDMSGRLSNGIPDTLYTVHMARYLDLPVSDFVGGFKIHSVQSEKGKSLRFTINKTMMRVDLLEDLLPGEQVSFRVDWSYNINDRMESGGRSGYEYFPEDKNYLYAIAQFYPRMAAYTDVEGWQNKQFLGNGEFALTFGDFRVALTVPSDHIVAATGELQNPERVLTNDQLNRLKRARTSFDAPVFVITEEEATQAEQAPRATGTKTWVFAAERVRDFAFASSRKFIWDAQSVAINDKKPLAMSFYPKEGNPLWERESTRAVVNTLKTYSKHTIDYPYPVAISVHTATIGMEYPMICFNWGRPAPDGSYSDQTKWRTIGVIVHEVGHNFFPMIINSDERQWTWMDEGLNSFVETLTCIEYYPDMPLRRGTPQTISKYMAGDKQFIRPIMTNSEQIIQFGNNAYSKPSAALHVLRETVMGRELFDYAFKEYANRWAFKSPTPADFFRTMEDASAVDLDWFWRGWFYSTDHVDMSIDNVTYFRTSTPSEASQPIEEQLKDVPTLNPLLEPTGFFSLLPTDPTFYEQAGIGFEFRSRLNDPQILKKYADKHFYLVDFGNIGGLVMPIVLEWVYEDGTQEVEKIPAEVWRKKEQRATRLFIKEKQVLSLRVDPRNELADTDIENNIFPRLKDEPSEVESFKKQKKEK